MKDLVRWSTTMAMAHGLCQGLLQMSQRFMPKCPAVIQRHGHTRMKIARYLLPFREFRLGSALL